MIVVLGLGRETRQLVRVLDRHEPAAEVLVLDERTPAPTELPATTTLRLSLIGGVDLDDPTAIPAEADVVYRSPGVSPYRPALAARLAGGVPVTTPTGWWAARRSGDDVIAVTGTKGKSTTAALTAHLLRAAGRRVSLRGNIGRAALDADDPEITASLDDASDDGAGAARASPATDAGPRGVQGGIPGHDDLVLELSSYQLVDLDAHVALAGVTTLLRDHVPWHGSLQRYHRDKLRLLELADRRIVSQQVAALVAPDRLSATTIAPSPEIGRALARAGLIGAHLAEDAALALALVDARLEPPSGVADLIGSLADFTPLPHRLTPVARHAGVAWVDDSISTVPESAVAAVAAYRPLGPVTVVLGGDDRGQDLAPLARLLQDVEVRAVLLPPLGERLAVTLRPVAGDRIHPAPDLPAAVDIAAEVTPVGGAVVLSPAAPSFGAYRDFVARGEHFVSLVAALTGAVDDRHDDARDHAPPPGSDQERSTRPSRRQ